MVAMSGETTVFLHVSDIHFHRERANGHWDLDIEVRNEFERDVSHLRDRIGPFDGILVTGDIAFAGKRREYEIARDWLKTVCDKLSCAEEHVWTVPGNHDVDRDVVAASPMLHTAQNEIRATDAKHVNERISEYMRDPLGATALYSHIREYNEFAKIYGCDIGPDKPTWQGRVALNDGSILRIVGLNSSLVSNEVDDNEQNKLVLGAQHVAVLRKDGEECMTLCHHPPSWIKDGTEVESALTPLARVQLYGHEHVQDVSFVEDRSVQLFAGALHPDREEDVWAPTYNILELCISNEGSTQRCLNVKIYARIWDEKSRQFVADMTADEKDNEIFSMPLNPWQAVLREREATPSGTEPEERVTVELGQADMMAPNKRMVYRFLTLPFPDQMAIAGKLRLVEDADQGQNTADLFKLFFSRARERGQIEEFSREIDTAYEKMHVQ